MTETTLRETIRKFDEVKQEVRTSEEAWAAFLTCAARNHKYVFQDQLLIYKQRPEATACAEMDLWNKRFHRWVDKGQKSIKLLDGEALRHVFDVGDTHPARGHENDTPPYIWRVRPEEARNTAELLAASCGVETDPLGLSHLLQGMAKNMSEDLSIAREKVTPKCSEKRSPRVTLPLRRVTVFPERALPGVVRGRPVSIQRLALIFFCRITRSGTLRLLDLLQLDTPALVNGPYLP
mgnify:CR=1 FL=1